MRRLIRWCFLLALILSVPVNAATSVAVGVRHGKAPPPPVIVFRGEPRMVLIPVNGVSYYDGPRDYDYFRYGPYFYIYSGGGYWYRALHARGPFVAIREAYVPLVFYGLDDRGYHWKHKWKHVPPAPGRRVVRRAHGHKH